MQKMQTQFFKTLFKGTQGFIEIRTIDADKDVKQYFYPTDTISRLISNLTDYEEFQNTNTYFGVCPRKQRKGKEENVGQVNCLWADLDCNNEEEREEILEKLKDWKLPPSIIVNSGHGLHCYWLFDKPHSIKTKEDILKFKGYTKGLAHCLLYLGADTGIDLSRVLRVPGTQNLKDPNKPLLVEILEFNPDRKYRLEEFEEYWVKVKDTKMAQVDVIAAEIPDRFWRILEEDPKIKTTWKKERDNLTDTSRTGYDMALANLLMPYNFRDSEIATILIAAPYNKNKKLTKPYLETTIGKAKAEWDKRRPLPLKEVIKTFRKWLDLEETDYIEVIIATILSNEIPGDPVWLFVIGPPGASKTEVLRAFNSLKDKTYSLSKLTAQSLISGKRYKRTIEGEEIYIDPSLLPKLDNKTLIIKDFTSILGMQREARETIFSDLREAYDGYFSKEFGNLGHVEYFSHFSLIGNVTPVIDKYTSVQQTLGERFLKIRLKNSEMDSKIAKAMDNEDKQQEMRKELASVTKRFYNQKFNVKEITFPAEIKEKTVQLAKFIAIGRTSVSRDQFRRDALTYLPEYEIGTRIGIQLKKLGKSLACIRGKQRVEQEEFEILKRISKDTLPKKIIVMLDFLYQNRFQPLSTSDITREIKIEKQTCRFILDDLKVLGLVKAEKDEHAAGKPWSWQLTDQIMELLGKIS